MSGRPRIPEEDREMIAYLLEQGYGLTYIKRITGWSTASIRRVADALGYGSLRGSFNQEKCVNQDIKKWLKDNWNWKRPSRDQPVVKKETGSIWKGKQRSFFITPYSYPKMWDNDGRR